MVKKYPALLWSAFLIVVILILIQNMVIFLHKPSYTGHASAQATIGLAICGDNTPPTINLSACDPLAFITTPYSCILNATDAEQTTFSFSYVQLSGPPVLFGMMVPEGNLFNLQNNNFSFWANDSSAVGNYTFRFTVDDMACGNSTDSEEFNLTINDTALAPYLFKPIPNRTMNPRESFVLDLDNYFRDPNLDPLVYQAIGNANIAVTVNQATGEATFQSSVNWCGQETMHVRATDPTNLYADSNAFTITVNCISTPTPTSSSSGSSSGSSGGGGGGSLSSLNGRCVSSYYCYEWSTCQLTRAVDPITGNSVTITSVLGSRTYIIPEEYSKDPDVYYQGFSYRECYDTRFCDNADVEVEVRPCEYKPSCTDKIKNQDETGVDCGGSVCPACTSCFDGIQNGNEDGVDCGGSCEQCNSCTNGKMDGKELGKDCGGPDCPVCATCFDGIKNQDETDVDCGGKYCKLCTEQQLPAAMSFPWFTAILLVLIGLILATLLFTTIKRQFAAFLLKILFRTQKKNRVVIIPANLKEDIIKRLALLEANVDQQQPLQSQQELARIVRDYFKGALSLDFEFTYEELEAALEKNKLNPLLSKILQQFFKRSSYLEFSGVAVNSVILRTLIQETRELVYQTAVLTVDDLKAREQDLQFRDIADGTPNIDRGYLLLSQVHLALQFHKLETAAVLYDIVSKWYIAATAKEQTIIFEDLSRVYDEYLLANR